MKNDSEGNRQGEVSVSSSARRLSFVGGDFHGLSRISLAMLCLKNSLSIVVTYIPISNTQM